MTIRNRLAKLESESKDNGRDSRPPILLGRAGMTDDDVIGLWTGGISPKIERLPNESIDDLIDRARLLLATPWAGMPLIMLCVYTDKKLEV